MKQMLGLASFLFLARIFVNFVLSVILFLQIFVLFDHSGSIHSLKMLPLLIV